MNKPMRTGRRNYRIDVYKRQYLLSRMEHRQTIVTACDEAAFARTDGKIYRMDGGCLTEK